MSHPSELPPPELRLLRDAEVPDFLESRRVALLAFLDLDDEASRKVRARVALLAARAGLDLAAGVVDVRNDRLAAEAMGVTSVPVVMVFVEGEAVDRLIGVPPERILAEAVDARLRA